jgi:hypothetical protein
VAIALVSAAALAWQLLLVRWLAIAHWHPFAVVIISLALLGHGASGTLLGLLLRRRRSIAFELWFAACALGFALSAAGCLLLARAIPFNGLELVWDPRQLAGLSALYLCLSLPFLFAASCFGLAFARHGQAIPLLYGADLLGAGVGAALALLLARLGPVESVLPVVAMLVPLAAVLVAAQPRIWLAAATITALLAACAATRALAPTVNPYKGLAKALLVRDAHIVAQRHGPQGWLAVVASPRVPLREVPGLSLSNTQEPVAQLGLYVDGDGPQSITRDAEPAALAYLGRTTSALPYALLDRPRVLVLGGGGGDDVRQALVLGARTVDVVDADAQRIALLHDRLARYTGGLYRDRRVHVHHADARAFVRASARRFDLIVLGQGASFATGSAGAQAVAEDYGATVEALRAHHARLAPGGLLAITRWEKQPPRDALKLFATAVAALREAGVDAPERRLLMLRNWDASTLLLRRGAFDANALARARTFLDAQGYDAVHLPQPGGGATNHFHALPRDDAAHGAKALLSPAADRFLAAYKFDVRPARDDRPYFANFFRWSTLPELWTLRAQGAAVLLDSGYLLLTAALVQAVPLALALVLLPLLALPRVHVPLERVRAGAYFTGLGLAFLLIEIACLARLGLLVGHPLLALGAGLAGFLVFAGAGSLAAQCWLARSGVADARSCRRAVLLIGLGLAWHLATFPWALQLGAAWPTAARGVLGLATIAPLAFAMGLPFPLGLSRLAREAPDFVPWAWGLNGCASVMAAIAALLLAIEFGLRATLLIALVLYAIAAWLWRERPANVASPQPLP